MKSKLETFSSGWVGISLSLKHKEIEDLMQLLSDLKAGNVGHFHVSSSNYNGDAGVADIEFSIFGEGDIDNMNIG